MILTSSNYQHFLVRNLLKNVDLLRDLIDLNIMLVCLVRGNCQRHCDLFPFSIDVTRSAYEQSIFMRLVCRSHTHPKANNVIVFGWQFIENTTLHME